MVTKLPLAMVVRPLKISNVLHLIRKHAQSGEFIILPHASMRGVERSISVSDIVFVLTHGEHEADKDEFKEAFQSWNYSVRGLTVDSRALRIAVAFDNTDMLIVSVIPLGRRRK